MIHTIKTKDIITVVEVNQIEVDINKMDEGEAKPEEDIKGKITETKAKKAPPLGNL